MLVRPITMKPARRSRATTGASASAGVQILQRARAGAGHLPLDVKQILDRDRNAGKRRRRRIRLAQPVHRVRRFDRGFLVDVDEGARALAGRVGDFGEALLDQLAGTGAAALEIVGKCGKCRMIRHGFLGLAPFDVRCCSLRPECGAWSSEICRAADYCPRYAGIQAPGLDRTCRHATGTLDR